MQYILFDEPLIWQDLLPLTFTRPIAEIRIGILTIRQKWEKYFNTTFYTLTEEYLQKKFPSSAASVPLEEIIINSSLCPDAHLVEAIQTLRTQQALYTKDNVLIAIRQVRAQPSLNPEKIIFEGKIRQIKFPYDIFAFNGEQIQADFKLITKDCPSAPITDPFTKVYHPENIFIEEGADLKACVLNAEKGVIYIGKNAQVQEMSVVQGNFALCEGSVINIGGKMRGDTTIGPYCKVGGEVSNSVIFGYSNKGHDGFLGNSVIGEWCNLGADTNTSNLKNNYNEVKIWNYPRQAYINTGRQFCGLTMGDHSKAGINTMFNTGTVVGVCANIFGGGFPEKFIPSFSWTGKNGNFEPYDMIKALQTAQSMMHRRGKSFLEADKDIFYHIFEQTYSV